MTEKNTYMQNHFLLALVVQTRNCVPVTTAALFGYKDKFQKKKDN